MIKTGVSLKGLQPQMVLAAMAVQQAMQKYGYSLTITGGSEGGHSTTGLHPKGLALDFRSKHIQMMDKPYLLTDIKYALGPEFDVLLEFPGAANEHLHIEFDPKPKEPIDA